MPIANPKTTPGRLMFGNRPVFFRVTLPTGKSHLCYTAQELAELLKADVVTEFQPQQISITVVYDR